MTTTRWGGRRRRAKKKNARHHGKRQGAQKDTKGAFRMARATACVARYGEEAPPCHCCRVAPRTRLPCLPGSAFLCRTCLARALPLLLFSLARTLYNSRAMSICAQTIYLSMRVAPHRAADIGRIAHNLCKHQATKDAQAACCRKRAWRRKQTLYLASATRAYSLAACAPYRCVSFACL